MGWHSGRIAQLEGREARAQAKTEHAQAYARVTEAVREQRRRQDEVLGRIRAAAAAELPTRRLDGQPETDADRRFFDLRQSGYAGPIDQDGYTPEDPEDPESAERSWRDLDYLDQPRHQGGEQSTEGSAMSGDTTYTQQMHELGEIRRDAEAEVNDVRRKRMVNRLDVLMSLGLDKDTLSDAAAIDDALQAQEKAAQQTLDATDAAIDGLKKRHGGIKEAVDDSPVDKPADGEFYQD